ncbi:hypothetical protein GE09DRAFT_284411 [Coniochaeta sp. 2T2.1]|nr:hypothetical protein GE09DRAFT_284411 [Coniochaeta sp. 2T2.1]
MHTLRALLLAFATLASAQDENLPQGPCDLTTTDECVEVMDGSSCYNSAVQAKNQTRLFSCFAGGENQVCNCYGCDRSMITFVLDNKLCGTNRTTG